MKTLALLTLGLWLYLSRLSRWLALYQQKEYRLDRFVAFLKTTEGKQELLRLISPGATKNPKNWKRPKVTARILVITAGVGSLLILGISGTLLFIDGFQAKLLASVFFLLASYLLLPAYIGVITAVTAIPARLKVWWELYMASQKINQSQPTIIGIGGSYGKTSTKYLIATLLRQKYQVFMTPKSYNTAYSIARSINQHYAGEEIVLLEYGAYKQGEIAALTDWFSPSHGVITGFTEQHLELFGSLQASMQAESELVAAIPSGGTVWFNADDARVQDILKQVPAMVAKTSAYSANDLGEWQLDEHGRLLVQLTKQITTNLVGSHYVTNLAAAVAVAAYFEVSKKEIATALATFQPDERFMRSYSGKDCWILDDAGTSNPEGFKTTISLAKQFVQQPKILVTSGIVDLGPVSDTIHRQLAESATTVFDQVWFVGTQGVDSFMNVLSKKCLSEQATVITAAKQLPVGSLLVIEGRMPGWLVPTLRKKGVK